MEPTIEQLQEQLQQEPDNAMLYYRLGLALQEKYPGYTLYEDKGTSQTWNFKGMDEIQKATDLDPMNYKYIHTCAMFREKRGDTEIALGLFKRCAELEPRANGLYDDIVCVQNSIKAQKNNNKTHAQERLNKKPDDVSALRLMGMAFGDEDNYEEAMKYYTKAVETGSDLENTYTLIGMFNCRMKRYEEAIEAYKKAIEHFVPQPPDEDDLNDPDYEPDNNASNYRSIAECYHELKDYDHAEQYYRQALDIDPRYHSINIGLGDIEYARGNYAGALALYKEGKDKLDEKQWRTLDELVGLCYFQMNDFENAKKSFEMCIKKNPGYSHAYYNLGVVYDRLGDEEGTEMVLQMAVQAKQTDVLALYQLAKIYVKKGYLRDALELLEKALFANPFETTVMELKAEIYAGMGDSEKAEMESGMAQFIKDIRDGKEFDFDDEDGEEDEEDEDEY